MIDVRISSGTWPPKVRYVVLHFGPLRITLSKRHDISMEFKITKVKIAQLDKMLPNK